MMGQFETIKFGNAEALALAAAQDWLAVLRSRGANPTPYTVALAGGRVAGKLFSAIAKLAHDQPGVLDSVHFFWGDERCVPPDDPESNFGLARDSLLRPLTVPDSRIHRMQGEKPPELAAREAERELYRWAPGGPASQPQLDLIFLGMGEDGHVASLFPGEPEEVMTSPRVYRPVIGPKPPPQRITLGYSAIVAARQVWVLVSGQGKQQAFRESLRQPGATPLARVLRLRLHTRILADIEWTFFSQSGGAHDSDRARCWADTTGPVGRSGSQLLKAALGPL